MSEYRTSDLALCAYLHLEGFGFIRCEKINERWAEMVFQNGQELRYAVKKYKHGNAKVEPREFQRRVGWVRGVLQDTVCDEDSAR